jgi:hypothetical protein
MIVKKSSEVTRHVDSTLSPLRFLLNRGELLHALWYHPSALTHDFQWQKKEVRTMPAYSVAKQQRNSRFLKK